LQVDELFSIVKLSLACWWVSISSQIGGRFSIRFLIDCLRSRVQTINISEPIGFNHQYKKKATGIAQLGHAPDHRRGMSPSGLAHCMARSRAFCHPCLDCLGSIAQLLALSTRQEKGKFMCKLEDHSLVFQCWLFGCIHV
jgi:hypothetical protein